MRSSKLFAFMAAFGVSVLASTAMAQDSTKADKSTIPTKFFDESGAYFGPDCDEKITRAPITLAITQARSRRF